MFVIVKRGVYTQNIYGPVADQKDAEELAKAFANADRDDYHKWWVATLDLVSGLNLTSFYATKG